MTTVTPKPDRLYDLLPAVYRIEDRKNLKDEKDKGELQTLLELITTEADGLREDTRQLWDDFFVETCRRWVIPYIGDLVGNTPLHDLDLTEAAATAEELFTDRAGRDLKPPLTIPIRADVAHTIYYRRRKGTPAMLEELAHDVTGWGAHVVEFFGLLDWNQHLEHLRPECAGCPDLRRVDACDRIDGPWDTATHTVDVRAINQWDGWYNVPNVGFFLWRLFAYPLTHVKPRAVGGTSWRLTFSPLGRNTALFSPGSEEPGLSGIVNELGVPLPIRTAAFYEDLRAALPVPASTDLLSGYYGDGKFTTLAVYEQTAGGAFKVISDVSCMNLENWTAIPAQLPGTTIGIDPTRGRLLLPTGWNGKKIVVSYHYGFSAPLGGGEYPRAKWQAVPKTGVATTTVKAGDDLDALVSGRAANHSVFEIDDDWSYTLTQPIVVAAGESLVIQANDGARPHVRVTGGKLDVSGGGSSASLTLSGLLLEGGVHVTGGIHRLRVFHSTLVPGWSVEQEAAAPSSGPSIEVDAGAQDLGDLELEIAFSIIGALRIPADAAKLWLLDSIVDGILKDGDPVENATAISDAAKKSGPPAHIERTTVLGACFFRKLELASESIFTGDVSVDQRQAGCVRFSYVTFASKMPQRYRCQPTLEIERELEQTATDAAKKGLTLPAGWDTAIRDAVVAWLVPSFESVRYGDAAFAQLRRTCPVQIRTGAEDGSEMGAFCVLKEPQREANLRIRLDEYLPVGLEAGLIYVT